MIKMILTQEENNNTDRKCQQMQHYVLTSGENAFKKAYTNNLKWYINHIGHNLSIQDKENH